MPTGEFHVLDKDGKATERIIYTHLGVAEVILDDEMTRIMEAARRRINAHA